MLILLSVIGLLAALLVGYIFFSGPSLGSDIERIIDTTLQESLPELVKGTTGFAVSKDAKIWYECIGTPLPVKGTVCLLASHAADGLMWPPSFIDRFIEAAYQVVRFDQRGTGLSDWMSAWNRKHPYSLLDMARDTMSVLDTLGMEKVHLFGLSLGGMVAQEAAINYPQRVSSLTLMMSSGDPTDPELPTLSSAFLLASLIKGLPFLKYRFLGGEKNLVRERIARMIQNVGVENFNVKETAHQVLYDLRKRKGINYKAILQHQKAVAITRSRYSALRGLTLPTLIIHGTEDKLLPFSHGKKLHELIPEARTVWLDGVGHVFPVPGMDILVREILDFLDSVPSHC